MTPEGGRGGAVERALTYGVPVASVVIAALVVLGPGAPRATAGVRVLGRVVEGSRALALRLVAVRRLYGVDEVVGGGRARVEASARGEALGAWEGPIGDDGVGEALVALAKPVGGAVDVRVVMGGASRASGAIPAAPPEAPRRGARSVPGVATGDVHLEVAVPRGALAPPSPEAIELRAAGDAKDVAVRADAPGVDLGPAFAGGDAHLGADGALRFAARALAHDVELTLAATDALARKGSWEGRLPVAPGAIWLDPEGAARRLRVVVPSPHDRVYASVVGADGARLFGASIAVERQAGAVGAVELPALAAPAHHVVLAGDPMENGAGTIAWPLEAAGPGAVGVRPVDVLVDGMPEVEAREGERARGARRSAMGLLGAAAFVEALLLARQSRRAKSRLAAHFAAASEGELGEGQPKVDLSRSAERGLGFGLAVYAALILLAFAMVGALASFR
jgi:hypothetical protein